MLDAVFTYWAQPSGFAPLQPFGAHLWQTYAQPDNDHWPTPGMHRVAAPSTALSRGESPATQSAVLQPFQLFGQANSFGGLTKSHPLPPPSLHGGDSTKTPEFDTSLDEPDAITSSVSSGFLHSVGTIPDTSTLKLATSIRSHKLWYQARDLLAPVPLATKMSASKLICYFSGHPEAFGFWSSILQQECLSESIRLSDWHWCCYSCHSKHRAAHLSPQSCPC